MTKRTVDMTIIEDCAATECAYNRSGFCRALAITVGDGSHPACDTYFPRAQHVQSQTPAAGVGACKVGECKFNRDLECSAPLVRIGHHAQHAECLTFTRP